MLVARDVFASSSRPAAVLDQHTRPVSRPGTVARAGEPRPEPETQERPTTDD